MKANIELSQKEIDTLDRATEIITEYNRLIRRTNNGALSENNGTLKSLMDDFIASIKTAQNIAS